jgi:hypothetical protein
VSATDGPLHRLTPDGPALTEAELTAERIETELATALGVPSTAVVVDERDFAGDGLHLTLFLFAPRVESREHRTKSAGSGRRFFEDEDGS